MNVGTLFSGESSWFYLLSLVLMKAYQMWQQYKKDNPQTDPLAELRDLVKALHIGNGEMIEKLRLALAGGATPAPVNPANPPGVITANVPVTFGVEARIKPTE